MILKTVATNADGDDHGGNDISRGEGDYDVTRHANVTWNDDSDADYVDYEIHDGAGTSILTTNDDSDADHADYEIDDGGGEWLHQTVILMNMVLKVVVMLLLMSITRQRGQHHPD